MGYLAEGSFIDIILRSILDVFVIGENALLLQMHRRADRRPLALHKIDYVIPARRAILKLKKTQNPGIQLEVMGSDNKKFPTISLPPFSIQYEKGPRKTPPGKI